MKTKSDAKIISRLFFSLLPIQILLLAIGGINSIIDGSIASHSLGSDAMAVTGLYLPIVKIIETINALMLGGSQILCGQFLGKNQLERTRNVFSLDMCVVVIVSLVITAISLLFPVKLSIALGADSTTLQPLVQYIFGVSFGILPQMIGAQLTAFLQLEQQQVRTYTGIAVMAVVNAVLDYVFLNVCKWGLFGLGLATTISYWVFFLVLGSYYLTKKPVIKFSVRGIKASDLKTIFTIGVPGAVGMFCIAIRGVVLNQILTHSAGTDALAALSSLNAFGCLLFSVTAGVATATRLLASVYFGEEDRESLYLVMKTALQKGVAVVAVFSALIVALAVPATYIFFKDSSSNVFYLTKWLFRIFPFSMPLSAICVIFINYYQCSSRLTIVNILSVVDGVLGVVLSSLVLSVFWGAMGVWIAHALNGVYTTIIVFIYAWIVNKKIPRKLEDYLALPQTFGVPSDKRLDISIHCQQDVVNTSERIIEFCHSVGVDKKRAFYAGLCLEEMASNIVQCGFVNAKKCSADIRVVYKDDSLILRIKDNGKPFDPTQKMKLIQPDDVTHNIGLRLVQALAKKTVYSSVLGLNVFTIVL